MYIYTAFLVLHSVLRWAVIGTAIWAITRAFRGKSNGTPYTPKDRSAALFYVLSLHLNAVIGFLLYAVFSPLTTGNFSSFGAAMKISSLRFFMMEHPFGMVIAIILATIGSAKIKRAADDAAKHKLALVLFGISFLILLISIPWPFYPAGRGLLPSILCAVDA